MRTYRQRDIYRVVDYDFFARAPDVLEQVEHDPHRPVPDEAVVALWAR